MYKQILHLTRLSWQRNYQLNSKLSFIKVHILYLNGVHFHLLACVQGPGVVNLDVCLLCGRRLGGDLAGMVWPVVSADRVHLCFVRWDRALVAENTEMLTCGR